MKALHCAPGMSLTWGTGAPHQVALTSGILTQNLLAMVWEFVGRGERVQGGQDYLEQG